VLPEPEVPPVRLRSSAWYVPCAYHPCTYTVIDVVDDPVVNVVESCCHVVADGVQLSL
jgi:acetoacetate decarboxylase